MSRIIRTEENSQLFSFQSGSLCLSCFSPALFVLDLDFFFFFYRPGFEGSCERKKSTEMKANSPKKAADLVRAEKPTSVRPDR